MDIQRISALSDGRIGGNPAGVVLTKEAVSDSDMQRVAAEVGYSETVFAYPLDANATHWRARYFSPETEVPFCGHATIALGAALTQRLGSRTYDLKLNEASITVDGVREGADVVVTLSSPPTHSRAIHRDELSDALGLLGLTEADLDDRLPPARVHAGADHLMLALRDRDRLRAMAYDLNKGRAMMNHHGIVTIMLVCIEGDQQFHVRNAFASGGVVEDPATGAAAADFAGYLRDQSWPHGGAFQIVQGEDMGARSIINVTLTGERGAGPGLWHDEGHCGWPMKRAPSGYGIGSSPGRARDAIAAPSATPL